MIAFLLIVLSVVLILQFRLGKKTVRKIHFRIYSEDYLAEPGEDFGIKLKIQNRSRLPAFFVKVSFSVPGGTGLCDGESGNLDMYGNIGEYSTTCFLMPGQTVYKTVRFIQKDRGLYRFSNLCVYVGDFIGLRYSKREVNGSCEVVVIPAKTDRPELSFLTGGLMGEHSVNRWIHEDPILTVGFREYSGREPQKSIAWTRSLQSGRLMVKQYDHTTDRRVCLILCVPGEIYSPEERCFSLCRTLCENLEEKKIPYSLYHSGCLYTAIGKLPPVESGLGKQHLEKILEGLGRATEYSASTTLEEIAAQLLKRDYDCDCCVLITPEKNSETERVMSLISARTGASVYTMTNGGSEP